MTTFEFDCADCGAHIVHEVKNGCGGCGYAFVRDDGVEKKVCYDCCAMRDRNEMADKGRITLYLSAARGMTGVWQNWIVSNWPGTLNFPVMYSRHGSHNIAGSRHDVWFTDSTGCEWHGVCYGDNTQLCHCRRLKRKHGPQGWYRLSAKSA